MKSFYLIALLCIIRFNFFAQYPGENRNDYSPYGLDYIHLSASMCQLANHEDATQITYFDLNFVDQLMQDFMRKEMGMAVVHFPFFGKENGYKTLTVKYAGQATMGTTKIQYLIFKYTLFDNKEKHTIIKSLTISGASNKVIYFYASYWPTTINFDGNHNQVAFNYLLQDKATIRLNTTNAAWSILIENTTIHSLDEYYKELNNSIKNDKNPQLTNVIPKPVKKFNSRNDFIRDSLIQVAQSYDLDIGVKIDSLTDIDLLKSAINDFEKKYINGHNYNSTNTNLISTINNTITPIDKVFFNGNIIINIDENGTITSITPYNLTTTMPQKVIDELKTFFIGKKIQPYSYGKRTFKSYKNYSILFMPPGMTKVKISDNGTLEGNPNVIWK